MYSMSMMTIDNAAYSCRIDMPIILPPSLRETCCRASMLSEHASLTPWYPVCMPSAMAMADKDSSIILPSGILSTCTHQTYAIDTEDWAYCHKLVSHILQQPADAMHVWQNHGTDHVQSVCKTLVGQCLDRCMCCDISLAPRNRGHYPTFDYEMHVSHFILSHRHGKPTLIASLTTAVPFVLYQDCGPTKHCSEGMSA